MVGGPMRILLLSLVLTSGLACQKSIREASAREDAGDAETAAEARVPLDADEGNRITSPRSLPHRA